jgi:hypothetical protein
MVAPIYWHRRVISANIIGLGEGDALQRICNALPIRQTQDIAYKLSYSKQKRK